jgi:hypothetical protein
MHYSGLESRGMEGREAFNLRHSEEQKRYTSTTVAEYRYPGP